MRLNPESGTTWQASWWIDDAYMIASVDACSTPVTGDQTCINNADLQRPRRRGDFQGQAPVLRCANALI